MREYNRRPGDHALALEDALAKAEVLSHWSLLMEDFQTSALGFYKEVEEALARREIPDIEISRVDSKEGGVASAKREYLRVRRGQLVFDICASPFGKSYFFSWWLARMGRGNVLLSALALFLLMFFTWTLAWESNSTFWGFFLTLGVALFIIGVLAKQAADDPDIEDWLLEQPIIGSIYNRLFSPVTYYKTDTATMFRESVRQAVMEVINGMREEKGLRALSESEAKPEAKTLV